MGDVDIDTFKYLLSTDREAEVVDPEAVVGWCLGSSVTGRSVMGKYPAEYHKLLLYCALAAVCHFLGCKVTPIFCRGKYHEESKFIPNVW